jgi:hypothetical protein
LYTSRVNLSVCKANSRVGERIRARGPEFGSCPFNFSNIGIRNAAVLPLPVRAIATTSLFFNITGIAYYKLKYRKSRIKKILHHTLRWIGVGIL